MCRRCGVEFERKIARVKNGQKFCSSVCYGLDKRRPFIIKNGYKRVICKGHPRANDHGYVREHILVMERKIGRFVLRGESIHHIDGDKLNNSPKNLILFKDHTEHLKFHWHNENLRKKNGSRVK